MYDGTEPVMLVLSSRFSSWLFFSGYSTAKITLKTIHASEIIYFTMASFQNRNMTFFLVEILQNVLLFFVDLVHFVQVFNFSCNNVPMAIFEEATRQQLRIVGLLLGLKPLYGKLWVTDFCFINLFENNVCFVSEIFQHLSVLKIFYRWEVCSCVQMSELFDWIRC